MTGADPAAAEPVGSVAEEAVKLFCALASSDAGAASTGAGASAGSEHVCTTSWCPVCQVVGFVRDNPEAVSNLTDSAAQLARSVRDIIDTALRPREDQ